MENKDLLIVAEAVSRENEITKDEVLTALEDGIRTSVLRELPEGADAVAEIDPNTGVIDVYRKFEIVEHIDNPEGQMLASEIEDEIVNDGFAYESLPFKMDRQKFSITRQVAMQKIKRVSFSSRVKDMLTRSVAMFVGTVKSARRDQVLIDCNGIDIPMPKSGMSPKDSFKPGDKITFTIDETDGSYFATRTSDKYLIEAFKKEIVQIEDGEIAIEAVARNPGMRSKVVVKSLDPRIDAVRTCIGPKGIHVKNIQSYLSEEFIDILPHSDDPVQMLIAAFEPFKITNVMIDEAARVIDVAIDDEDVPKAVGKGRKNLDMISKIVGWKINAFSQTDWNDSEQLDGLKAVTVLSEGLGCDEEVAAAIVEEGFLTIEDVAYVPKNEFLIEGLSDEDADSLRAVARNLLENPTALANAVGKGELAFLGFDESEIAALKSIGASCNHDVAELSSYDLQDAIPDIDEERAKAIIVKSRKIDSAELQTA